MAASTSGQRNDNKYGITPFNGNGYDNWKFRLESVLKTLDVNDVLERTTAATNKAWVKRNNKAVMVIIQSIADSHLEYVKGMSTAAEIISKLDKLFAKNGTCSKFYLLEELIRSKYDGRSNLQDHFAKRDKIFRELKKILAVNSKSQICQQNLRML